MGLFSPKPACRQFFTYATKTLDFSGLSAGLSSAELADFDFKLGQFKLSPEFVKVSEKLMLMDLQQYDLCQTIANIRDKSERDRMFTQLAEIKMEMIRMAANPEAYEKRESKILNPATLLVVQLLEHNQIPEALKEADKIPFIGEDRTLFIRKREKYYADEELKGQALLDWIRQMKVFLLRY
ncbi:MAG: hypothetical protein WCI64_09355 [Chlorobium sp.]